MDTQIVVTMSQDEALERLQTEIREQYSIDGMEHSVSVVVIGINDDHEEKRRNIIEKCKSMPTKIAAVKYFREMTGSSLHDTKYLIESEDKMDIFINTGKI